MTVAIVRKIFEDGNKSSPGLSSYTRNLVEFLLKAFNKLSYNCEVNGPLIARFL